MRHDGGSCSDVGAGSASWDAPAWHPNALKGAAPVDPSDRSSPQPMSSAVRTRWR
jgi:hypothetical protein